MRVVMIIASGIFATRHHHVAIIHNLGFVCYDITFALFGNDMANESAFGLQIIAHLIRFIRIFALLENRTPMPFFRYTVIHTGRIDGG